MKRSCAAKSKKRCNEKVVAEKNWGKRCVCALKLANCKFDVCERAKLSKKAFQSGADKREHSLAGCL